VKTKILLEEDEDGFWTASVPPLPGCISQGKTKKEAENNIRKAISLHLEELFSEGVVVPRSGKVIEKRISVSV
jgi:predicted RNase H-like HicB family nuclease